MIMVGLGSRLALLVVIAATVGCDRVTKHMATAELAGQPAQSFFADTVRLTYERNLGGFLSLGAELPAPVRTALFVVATGIVLACAAFVAFRLRWRPWQATGLALFIGGGLSNWIDRILHGSVVDFLNVGIGWLRTGVFNVADIAIMTGIALLLLSELSGRRKLSPRNP